VLAPTVSYPSPRDRTRTRYQVNPVVFLASALAAALLLVSMVAIPQWFARQARWEELRANVGQTATVAASMIDGDLHHRLLDPANYTDELYALAVKPLVRFHNAEPNIFYLYTMVERSGVAYFVLDTAASPDLHTSRKLEASGYMERFEVRKENQDDWLQQIAAGKTYITPSFETDDYGTFLTAHAPIYDSKGVYSGFVGIDFDTQFYAAREARFRAIAYWSLGAALILSMVIGYLAALYQAATERRIRELRDHLVRDSLTGLYNRSGALEFIKRSLERHAGQSALLVVDINNLNLINELRGHSTGDAVILRTSEAVQEGMREGDQCARFGGDHFIIFAPDCGLEGATEIARRILSRLSGEKMPLTGARFSVSIGIATHDGPGAEFDRMCRDADDALNEARKEGSTRIGQSLTTRAVGI
jgi:diguanylate cyclase (GGDEF)-like protein